MSDGGESGGARPTVCLECGGPLGRKPRRDGARPPDVCASCWKRQRPWEDDSSFRERAQTRRRDELQQLHAEGLCTDCRQPFEGDEYRCPDCRAGRNEQEREAAAELVETGWCRRKCGRRAAPGRTRCEECLAEAAADSQQRRVAKRGGARALANKPLAERCSECGAPMGRRPRWDSGRPLDVCTTCWARRSEDERRQARKVARRRELQRRRYAERTATDPAFAENKRRYMRAYMRERRAKSR